MGGWLYAELNLCCNGEWVVVCAAVESLSTRTSRVRLLTNICLDLLTCVCELFDVLLVCIM